MKISKLILNPNITGAPPPRPGQKRQQDNRPQNQRNDRSNFSQGQGQGRGQGQGQGGNNNNRNNQNRRQDGNKKFGGGKNDWTQGGGWGGNWGNYGGQGKNLI